MQPSAPAEQKDTADDLNDLLSGTQPTESHPAEEAAEREPDMFGEEEVKEQLPEETVDIDAYNDLQMKYQRHLVQI